MSARAGLWMFMRKEAGKNMTDRFPEATFNLLAQASRFHDDREEESLVFENCLGKMLGFYDNAPFGDDLYIYQEGIYWNNNTVNYCFFYREMKEITLDSEHPQGIVVALDDGETFLLPVRNPQDREIFYQFLNYDRN